MAAASIDQTVRTRSPSPGRAATMIALYWAPALVLAAGLPWFVPVFDRWPARWGALPALTRALMSVGQFGVGPIVLAGSGLVAVLAGGGAGWVWAGLPGRRTVVLALAGAGLGALVAGFVGTLGQIITAPVGFSHPVAK